MYAKLIGSELIDDEDEVTTLYHSAPLHDVGKIGIPDSVLLKPGALTDEEFDVIKTHTVIGHKMLSESKSKYLQQVLSLQRIIMKNGMDQGIRMVKKGRISLCLEG